jgi:hypothetical protein
MMTKVEKYGEIANKQRGGQRAVNAQGWSQVQPNNLTREGKMLTIKYEGNDRRVYYAYNIPEGTRAEDFLAANNGRRVLAVYLADTDY